MNQNIHVLENSPEVAKQFAADLVAAINAACTQQCQYNLALSGGSTPKLLFEELAANYMDKAPWDKVHFWWGDERCVPANHAESNYAMAHELFLNKLGQPAVNIHRILGENTPEKEAVRYAAEIESWVAHIGGVPRFDLVILGMGADGHTASIFPHQMELLTANSLCALATHPDSGQLRISFTGKLINNAAKVAFLVTGASKQAKVKAILTQSAEAYQYPAAHIKAPSGKIDWYLDGSAHSA